MKPTRLTFEAPYGCRWCGTQCRHHGRRWTPIVGMHAWDAPSDAMVLERMTRRRADRLAALPAVYHATTAWAPEYDGESGVPFCADCKTDVCHRWARIQARLDQQRWGLPRRIRRHGKTTAGAGGWGGHALPF